FVTLINWVILDPGSSPLVKIINPDTLATLQQVAMPIGDATLGIMTLLIVVTIALQLSKYRQYDNPIAAILTSLVALFVVTPMSISVVPDGMETAITVGGIDSGFIGASGMFVGIIVGLVATDIFIKLTQVDKFKINITGQIPPSVISSFNVL